MWDALESRMEEFLDSISIEDLFREKPEEQTREVSA
jgi:DNA-binding IscR family transcriptional regulator